MRGVVSVTGSMSPTMEEKMVMASMMVTPEWYIFIIPSCVNKEINKSLAVTQLAN